MTANCSKGTSMAMAFADAREKRRRARMWEGGVVDEYGDDDNIYNTEPMASSGEPLTDHRRSDTGNMPLEGFGDWDYRRFKSELGKPGPDTPRIHEMALGGRVEQRDELDSPLPEEVVDEGEEARRRRRSLMMAMGRG